MRQSVERILSTHTGSLPRPEGAALPGTAAAASGARASEDEITRAVAETVQHQVDAGVDIVNDGEVSKRSYSTYVTDRLSGFEEGITAARELPGKADFPEFYARMFPATSAAMTTPVCMGPVVYQDTGAVQRDIANLKAATAGSGAAESFMTAASPGVIAQFMSDQYYNDHEAYVRALGQAMRVEYEAIADAGIILQVDCPDLACWPVYEAKGMTKPQYLDMVSMHVEVLNEATAAIAPESMRMHVCWGNFEGPHNRDIPLIEIIDRVLPARPSALLFEAANPRHEHEWAIFKHVPLPDGKVLIPGVLDTTTNYIEHPELVAERLERLARIVGMEKVIAGSDCGFATFAGSMIVDPRIVWAKMQSMVEGADIATRRLAGPST